MVLLEEHLFSLCRGSDCPHDKESLYRIVTDNRHHRVSRFQTTTSGAEMISTDARRMRTRWFWGLGGFIVLCLGGLVLPAWPAGAAMSRRGGP